MSNMSILEESETATAVNSLNNSCKDLSQPNKHEKILIASEKYLKYIDDAIQSVVGCNDLNKEDRIFPKFTGVTLMGEDKINHRGSTLYFIDEKYNDYPDILDQSGNNYSVTFLHLGNHLTGHSGIIHGGLLATLLDELTCRLAFHNFISNKGVTANLNINYRSPCYSNNFVMIKCSLLSKVGRKCRVKGLVFKVDLDDDNEIESKENLLADCEVLVIEPKWVKDL